MNFPPHACGLYLEHNTYRDIHQDIETAVIEEDTRDNWVSTEERQQALNTGELWTLQWYPRTPVGFYRIAGASLDAVLAAAMAVSQDPS